MTDQYVEVQPPLQILDTGNGCEAFSPTIYIPAKSELTATLQSITRSMFFLNYNTKYTNITQYLVWIKLSFTQLTPEEAEQLKSKLQLMPAIPVNEFEKELELIDTNYPLSIPTGLQMSVPNCCWPIFLAIFIIGIWLYCKHKSWIGGLWNLTSKVPDLLWHDLSPITQLLESWPTRSTNDIEPIIPPPVLVPSTSQPIPLPRAMQLKKPSSLAISLPSTPTPLSDEFELTSLDNEPTTQNKWPKDKKKSTSDYV